MAKKKKAKTLRAKKAAKPVRFASGKKVDPAMGMKYTKEAREREIPSAIVLDRVAKTFARLEAYRESSGTPMLDSFLKHVDERGLIQNVLHEPVGAVAVITSKANTVRANHYHKEDAHLCFVVKGRIEYYERPVGSIETPEKFIVQEGYGMYTGPKMEHAMYFPEDTIFLTLGRLSRTPTEYEQDLVRLSVPLMLPKVEVPVPVNTEAPPPPPPAETPTAGAPQEA
ncbi:MAG: hypothetical protein EPN91_08450 [Salinibacterium sp.]|nr:MAG: hypothetical protein EPN91_08450 [Salinibacterium sp.]